VMDFAASTFVKNSSVAMRIRAASLTPLLSAMAERRFFIAGGNRTLMGDSKLMCAFVAQKKSLAKDFLK